MPHEEDHQIGFHYEKVIPKFFWGIFFEKNVTGDFYLCKNENDSAHFVNYLINMEIII